MSFLGKQGKNKQIDEADYEKVEEAISNVGFEVITQKYPELAFFIEIMEQRYPDEFAILKEHPEYALTLYEKFQPFISKVKDRIMGEAEEEVTRYDA